MGWTCGKNGKGKIGKDSRCPESGRNKEARKTENAMGGRLF